MTLLRISTAATLALMAPAALHGQLPEADRFRYERAIVTAGPGPQRLAIDVPLLAGAQPFVASPWDARRGTRGTTGLSDFRLVSQDGTPVPYLLLHPRSRQPVWTGADVLLLARTEKTSGFEADFRMANVIDAIRVSGLLPPFLKRLTLEGSGDREHWTLLAGEGTLFDLPEDGLRQTDLGFSPGSFRYLRVTWDDTNSGRVPLPAMVQARVVSESGPPPALRAALGVEHRPSEPGRSRYRIKLPAPRLPIVALELTVAGGYVFRDAAVSESRLAGGEARPAELGRAKLSRVVRGGIAAGTLRIPIEPPAEAEIDLVIDDGGNPPLDLTGVTAVFTELPWIYFEAPAGPITARYGNPSAMRPQYDLEAVRDSVDVRSLKEAKWGEARPLATADRGSVPAAVAVPATGATIDGDLFRYRRSIPDGPVGLDALVLDAAAMAHSRGPGLRFSDVRILDGSNRQIPYVLERRDEPLTLNLTLQAADPGLPGLRPATGRNHSTYRITLPYARMPPSQFVLDTPARVFQRQVQLGAERQADRHRRDRWLDVLASATWTHADDGAAAPALILPLPEQDNVELWLTVDEGDNAPLPITLARLLLPSYRLRFYRPERASLRLAYGRADLVAPQYDLALLAPQVMGVEAREVTAVPENTDAAARAGFISPRAFWAFLSVAVVVLLGLIIRLARRQGEA